MEEHTYKQIELTGTSRNGTDEAVRNAIAKAGESVKHMDWFKVIETRGYIEAAAVKHWQVTIKIGFKVGD